METVDKSDKVSQALATLKSELIGIREQDVGLMKQLLKIKETIKQLSPNKDNSISCNTCQVVRNGADATSRSRRQRYLSYYVSKRRGSCGSSNGSLSSIEENTSSIEDCTTETESETDDVSGSEENVTHIPTWQSRTNQVRFMNSRKLSLPCSSDDEHLLISNIKVWKYKQSKSIEDLKFFQ